MYQSNGSKTYEDTDPDWQRQTQQSNQFYSTSKPGTMRGTKSQGAMPMIFPRSSTNGSSYQTMQKVEPRTKDEIQKIFQHLTAPTKSLQLRSQAIVSWKQELNLMYKKNSRILDNHFAPNIHRTAWIAPGASRKQKYESDGTGIALAFEDKDLEFKIQQDKQQVEKLQKDGFRQWSEYEKIREDESLITIEYCTNCHDHQGTTRHDEKKYEFIANNLKKEIIRHYPTIKVYMKPLLTESQDQSIENQYARSRLGAMEVQFCTNRNGRITKSVIFSKLKSKCWPSTLGVLNEIRNFMDKCTLTVSILHETFDPMDLSDEQKRTSENKLYNIEVTLRPYRKINQQSQQNHLNSQRMTSTPSNHQLLENGEKSRRTLQADQFDTVSIRSRPNSAYNRNSLRPTSAQSAMSIQSYSILPQMAGHAPHGKTIEIKEKSNSDGLVTFKDLPVDVYVLEINETNDFRSCRDQIDIFKKLKEYQDKPEELSHQVLLESVQLTFAKISIKGDTGDKESVIRITKEGDEENELEGKIKHEYNVTLEPGKYTVVVENKKLGRIIREHIFPFGNQELTLSFSDAVPYNQNSLNSSQKPTRIQSAASAGTASMNNLKPARPGSARPQSASTRGASKKELALLIYEAGKNASGISNCKIEIADEIRGTKEFFTDKDGLCIIFLDGYSKGSIKINHDDFLPICEEYGPTLMNLNTMKELSFPLIRKPETETEANFLLFTDVDKKILSLHVIGPDGVTLNSSKKDIIIENNPEQKSSLIKITKARETKGVYRIFAKVHDIGHLNPSSVKFYVVTSSSTLNFIEVPRNHPSFRPTGDIFWDIGALCVPSCKFIEINAVQSEPVTRDYALGTVKAISELLQKAAKRDRLGNQAEIRNLLGFPEDDPKVLQSNNDFCVAKELVVESLSKIVGQNKTKASTFEHLVNSSILTNGLCSFSKLRQKFLQAEFPPDFVVPQETAVHQEESDEDDGEEYDEYYNDK